MCGRYALALRPAQVRQMLQEDNMPADDAPADDDDSGPRSSYNFCPGYRGVVYRADVPDRGAGPPRRDVPHGAKRKEKPTEGGDVAVSDEMETSAAAVMVADAEANGPADVRYKLQSMKWGLIPFWTKRNPDYGSMMKTINCRDDSLAQSGGMWSSMKARKRCVVVAQGFYEWLKKDREKVPHFVKRRDGRLMCFAGLWDVVQYENDEQKTYTYTIITTDSNKQLNFLHDRMPVILDNGSEGLRTWLDPRRHEWSAELQALLRPFEGELDVYPVSREVGKVGNNSASFILPVDSRENKSNIANFFANAQSKSDEKNKKKKKQGELAAAAKQQQRQPEVEVKEEHGFVADDEAEPGTGAAKKEEEEEEEEGGEPPPGTTASVKREADDEPPGGEPPKKMAAKGAGVTGAKNSAPSPQKGSGGRPKISATSNGTKSPGRPKQPGTQKITKFFANSS
ncbi:DUF159-domain-containing protein [Xylariaceae sp. FL0804]|nr:DUF159-domain-containing protein [Xylariaceae sp. FL0804]